ncbi:MAG: orotidine-5'-phosphate decarboxylase [Melioribacter sp.]|nr:orotidine-5'-phosphate decarboxylase [Melioribacter sp.]
MNALEKLKLKFENNLHVCIGLDTDVNKIPDFLKKSSNPVFEFNKIVIENTCREVAAYKINFAFYEKDGLKGIENLLKTIELIPQDILIIADAKRGDIGNTSKMYAESVFNYFRCDAVTLHPYMGYDSLEPFLEYEDKLSFILTLTSNKGANDFEKLKLDTGEFLFQIVIKKVKEWNKKKNCGIVFGATNLEELRKNIEVFEDLPVLLPGVGAQGGDLNEIANIFALNNKFDYLVNVSRALIYCDKTENFPLSIKQELSKLNSVIKMALLKQ